MRKVALSFLPDGIVGTNSTTASTLFRLSLIEQSSAFSGLPACRQAGLLRKFFCCLKKPFFGWRRY
ncbi:MAG: hypothetical protein KKC11_08430 [Candidatus Omnitrophica bacterium]|nr:hypothetical protein [Candidatus Omnitrophota bacterium]